GNSSAFAAVPNRRLSIGHRLRVILRQVRLCTRHSSTQDRRESSASPYSATCDCVRPVLSGSRQRERGRQKTEDKFLPIRKIACIPSRCQESGAGDQHAVLRATWCAAT